MASDPFFGIKLKLSRAHKQFEDLVSTFDAFNTSKPYKLVRYYNPEARQVGFLFHVLTPIPPEWGIIAGEIIYDLRSALDHLIWQLVILETGQEPTTYDTQFPIFQTEVGYDTNGEPRRLKGVGVDAKTLIKSLQPFDTRSGTRSAEGTNSPLWHLHELSNWDKHRTIYLACATTTRLGVECVFSDEIAGPFITGTGPVEHGAPLGGILFREGITVTEEMANQVHVKGEVSLDVAFKQPMVGALLRPIINAIGLRVQFVINKVATEIFEVG